MAFKLSRLKRVATDPLDFHPYRRSNGSGGLIVTRFRTTIKRGDPALREGAIDS